MSADVECLTWDYKLLCLHQTNLLSTDHNLEFLCFENGLFRHLHCDIESVMLHITAAKGLHLKSHQRCPAGIRTCLSADQSSSSTLTESSFLFDHCLIPEVLNSSPRAPTLCIFCMSLFVNTPDSDNQLVRSVLHAWTVFRLTCSLHRVHCSLLPEQGKSAEVYVIFGTFIHGFALRNVFTHGRVWHHIPL